MNQGEIAFQQSPPGLPLSENGFEHLDGYITLSRPYADLVLL